MARTITGQAIKTTAGIVKKGRQKGIELAKNPKIVGGALLGLGALAVGRRIHKKRKQKKAREQKQQQRQERRDERRDRR